MYRVEIIQVQYCTHLRTQINIKERNQTFSISCFRAEKTEKKQQDMLTKVDFFADKLTGCDNASARRAALARFFDLPDDMTANALLDALNIITDREGYRKALESIE